MMSDCTEYQSAETAWRFHSRRDRLQRQIMDIEEALKERRTDLAELESRPPRYHLFNWSA